MRGDPGSLPDPNSPAFETIFRVRFHEVDALGHVNNAAYLNYLEQAAIDHATFLGLDLGRLRHLGGVFVARRHEIDFLRPTFAGNILRVITWLGETRGARVERRYLVFRDPHLTAVAAMSSRQIQGADIPVDGELVVRATTEWVFTNELGQPRRVPDEVIAMFRAGTAAEANPE